MINTMSSFIYGFDVNANNRYFNITINATAYEVALNFGTYTIPEIINEIKTTVESETGEVLEITVDHSTRLFTISHASLSFELNISTGNSLNFFRVLGFTGADVTGASTYTSNVQYGYEFRPQVKLQNFTPFENNQNLLYASVSKSAIGKTQTVNFGTEFFMSCAIVLQTNEAQAAGGPIENQANGANNLRDFMEYVILKNKIMFKEDRSSQDFTDCLLESTPQSPNGTSFTMSEYLGEFPEYFTTGNIRFRKV